MDTGDAGPACKSDTNITQNAPRPTSDSLSRSVPFQSRGAKRLLETQSFLKTCESAPVGLVKNHEDHSRHACFARKSISSDGTETQSYIPGLCRILQKHFFGAGSYGRRKKKEKSTGATQKAKGLEAQLYPDLKIESKDLAGAEFLGSTCGGCHAAGKRHGTLVHHQVAQMIMRYQKRKKFDAPYYTAREIAEFRWDPCAMLVVDHLVKNQYWPIATELIVYDLLLDIATAIDFVVIDTRNMDVIFIELKTSTSDSEFEGSSAALPKALMRSSPFSSVEDTILNRSFVQSIATGLLANRVGGSFRPDRYAVLFVSSHQTAAKEYGHPEWYLENPEKLESELYEALLKSKRKPASKTSSLPQKSRPKKRPRPSRPIAKSKRTKHE